jgi:Tfp pilus assembly protein PilZ
MSTIEMRRHERIETRLQVKYGTHGFDLSAPLENISLSGICIRTNDVFPAGTRIKIQIEFPDRQIVHTGEVMWAIKVPERDKATMMCGMGIQFVDPGDEWADFFASWKAGLG